MRGKGDDVASSESTISSYWIAIEGRSEYAPYLGENMGLGYDIFRESSNGPLWVAQAATLTEAKEKLEILARSVPARYFVRDAASAKIVGRAGPDTSEGVGP
jgi:hypothetical protein